MRLLFAEDADFLSSINNQHHRLPLMWFVDNIEEIFSEFKERNIEIADDLRSHPYGLENLHLLILTGITSGWQKVQMRNNLPCH